MPPRTSTARPTARPPSPRPRYIPAGPGRVLTAIRPWRHLLRPGAAEVLAFLEWQDLTVERDERRLEEEVARRLARPETRRLLIEPFDIRSRVEPAPPLEALGPEISPSPRRERLSTP